MKKSTMVCAALAAGAGFASLTGYSPLGGTAAMAQTAEVDLPAFPEGAVWVNSDPLTLDDLLGQVLIVEVWTLG